MYMVIAPRSAGKTTRLLDALVDNPKLVLFVSRHAEADRVRDVVRRCYKGRVDPDHILVLGQDKLHGTNKIALIDNIDMCLEKIVGGHVEGGSCTGPVSELTNPYLTDERKTTLEDATKILTAFAKVMETIEETDHEH